MANQPTFLMVDPQHFDVSYSINPWMQPQRWAESPSQWRRRAVDASCQLQWTLQRLGGKVEVVHGEPGLPDMVFPANAAIVLDGRALMARFRHPQRRGEEPEFLRLFESLRARGWLQEVAQLPHGVCQEGAGDCIWDAGRGHFWAGFGPRSSDTSPAAIADYFGRPVVPLPLAGERCYHLDVGFLPLSGGEILYLPDAFTPQALATLRERVPADQLLEATGQDLLNFNINAVEFNGTVVMSRTSQHLRSRLAERGYRIQELDLSPFMMSGGAAYCMTLRLDRSSAGTAVQGPVATEGRGGPAPAGHDTWQPAVSRQCA